MTGSQAGKLMPRGNGKWADFQEEQGNFWQQSPPAVEIKQKKKGLPGASVMVVMVLQAWAFKGKYTEQKKAHVEPFQEIFTNMMLTEKWFMQNVTGYFLGCLVTT